MEDNSDGMKIFLENQLAELDHFKSEMMQQTQTLKKAMDVDYKEIKNMFAECQDQINDEDKWLNEFKYDVDCEYKKIKACEKEMFDYESGKLEPTLAFRNTIQQNRLVGNSEFNS